MSDILNVNTGIGFDESISKIEYHAYSPFLNEFNNSDEIRICIQNQDLILLPHESYLSIEGKLLKNDGTVSTTAALSNNAMAYLFEEIRYELNDVEIDQCKYVGPTTTLINYLTLNENEGMQLANAPWSPIEKINISNTGYFNFCIPLARVLGFLHHHKKVIINAKHQLILIRARTDLDAVLSPTDDVTIQIQKIQWMIPHVTVADEQKLKLLKYIESSQNIPITFRSWDMHIQPTVPSARQNIWTVKTSTQLEKPRYIIFALQTNRRNRKAEDASVFDHCELSDIKVYLNSETYPYMDLNLDFKNGKYAIAYHMYSKFQQTYYNTNRSEPLLSKIKFKEIAPIIFIDCSHQNESLKSGSVDVRIEFKTLTEVPANTSAFCLLIHDRIVQYNPLTNIVSKFV